MKFAAKLFLVIAIFCVTIFATEDDGHMTNGGLTCKGNCPPPTPTPTPSLYGAPNPNNQQSNEQNASESSILEFIQDYLSSIFG